MADSPLVFTIVGGVIGVAASLGAIVLRHWLEQAEKRKDRIRHRGGQIETLIDDYERSASNYWSSPDLPDKEDSQKINALKSRIGRELGNIAKQKGVNCKQSEGCLMALHQAATWHDEFSTTSRQTDYLITLKIQDAASEMRAALHLDLDML